MSLLIYIQTPSKTLSDGTLAYFNGLTMALAVCGTGSWPQVGPVDNVYYGIFMSWWWTVAMCYFGYLLGWFNVTITFPRMVPKKKN